MDRELTCIGCPLGCQLHITGEAGALQVSGNTCPRGKAYAITECTAPVRRFTGTVALSGGTSPVLPVKTAQDVPKERILAVAEACRSLRAAAPLRAGDVVCENIAGTGVALVAERGAAAV